MTHTKEESLEAIVSGLDHIISSIDALNSTLKDNHEQFIDELEVLNLHCSKCCKA